MDVAIQKPDGTITYVSGTPKEIKDFFFGVTDLPKSPDETEGLAPGMYAVVDGYTPEYLTTGKYYRVGHFDNMGFDVTSDDGNQIFSLWEGSSHLEGGNWRKVVVE